MLFHLSIIFRQDVILLNFNFRLLCMAIFHTQLCIKIPENLTLSLFFVYLFYSEFFFFLKKSINQFSIEKKNERLVTCYNGVDYALQILLHCKQSILNTLSDLICVNVAHSNEEIIKVPEFCFMNISENIRNQYSIFMMNIYFI